MFQENISVMNMLNYIKTKFPNCVCDESSIKIFNDLKEEYKSLRYGAGIRIINPVIIQLNGTETLDFLHRISTNEVKNLKQFEKKNTLFLNDKGRFIDRTSLLHMKDFYILVGSMDKTNKLINWINKYIITEDIETKDVSSNYSLLEIIGPQSISYLTLILGEQINSLNNDNILQVSIDEKEFYLFVQKENDKLNIYKILIESAQLPKLIEYFWQNKSIFDVNFVGEDAYNIFRVEMGIPDVSEVNFNYNPHEINLTNEISFTKGCYIGQEVIARLETYDKVQRKLCGIVFQEEIDNQNVGEIFNDRGEEIGTLTSIVHSELLNTTIGLAVVRKKYLALQSSYYQILNKKINLTIVDLPFSR